MGYVIKIETKHSGDMAEKSTLLANTSMYNVTEQRKIVEKMVEIFNALKSNGKKDNWMTGLDSTKTLNEQYESIIGKVITQDEFNFFKTLVPKGEYGTSSIVTVISAEEANWKNKLV